MAEEIGDLVVAKTKEEPTSDKELTVLTDYLNRKSKTIYGSLKMTDILTEPEKRVAEILSDPDWRAWLEK